MNNQRVKVELNKLDKSRIGVAKMMIATGNACYTLHEAIKFEIKTFLSWYVCHMNENFTIEKYVNLTDIPYISNWMKDALPTLARVKPLNDKMFTIVYHIVNVIPSKFNTYIESLNIDDPNTTDFEFITLLGKKRDWNIGCPICLEKRVTGITCHCGCSEIILFRPCGHVICGKPCFVEFANANGLNLHEYVYTIGKMNFNTVDSVDYDIDFSGKNIKCPICREIITRSFRTELVKCDITNNIVDIWTNEIIQLIE